MTQIDTRWPVGDGEMAGRIRDFDWSATPLGPIAGWSERLKLAVELVLASPLVSTLACGPQRLLVYNDAAARHFGDHHPAALGHPLPDTFPEGWATVAPYYARAFDGETVKVGGQPLDTRGEGVATDVFDALLAPVRESDGSIAYVHMTGAEVGDRALIETALRASEEKYRTLFENMGQGYALGEVIRDAQGRAVDLRFLELNPAFERLSGIPVAQAQGRTVREVYGEVEPEWFEVAERVARLKVPERVEYEVGAIGRWFQMHFYPAEGDRYLGLYEEVTERKRAEAALRESEERQAFLLKLSDLLRPLSDPAEIQHAAMKLLAEQYDVMRAGYLDVHADGDTMTMAAHFERDAVPAPPQIRLSDYGPDLVAAFHAGHTRHVRDTIAEAETEAQRAAYRVLGVRSWIIAPVVKGGRLTAIVGVVSRTPRAWTPIEIQRVTDLAERTWDAAQRARSEVALRESEERFAQFAKASAAGLWIRDARTLAMEFVSPAVGTIYGVAPDALLGDVKRWAAMIVPDDRDVALGHLEEARRGSVAVHEFRIQRPSDGAFRWIRNTDFPLRDAGRIPRIGGIAEDVTEAKLAAEHSAVLLAELQHRVRNIMALLRSITDRTAERAEDVPEYRDLMMGRLLAFARVQALLTRTANVGVGIASIVHDEVSVQVQHEGQYSLDGPDVALSPKAAEVLTLAIHELATNAVKYGALSAPDGKVTVRWSTFDKRGGPWLAFDWTEEGAPMRSEPAPDTSRRRGFGSELIEGRIPYELRGRGQVTIGPGGAHCRLEFPLQGGASILETGAPQRASVFGGAIDMTGEPDLTGRRVLVVEDDYYLATDAARALRGAGAEVMGPCATEADAREELEEQRPDAAVVDINLGPGPSFKLAETLKDRGIPFVFTTGYDADVIPAEFEGVERLEKPLQLRQIVGAVARLTPKAT